MPVGGDPGCSGRASGVFPIPAGVEIDASADCVLVVSRSICYAWIVEIILRPVVDEVMKKLCNFDELGSSR